MSITSSIALNNGIKMPIIGMGGWAQEKEQILQALYCGYRLLDTAAQYGNEEEFGAAIAESNIIRNEIFLTTKLWTEDIRQHRVREAFNGSLERLQTDYIDLYVIHWPAEGFEDSWLEMEKLYQRGKIRAIGVSNFEPHHLRELEENGATITPAVNQVESHPYFSNQEVIDYCKGRGIVPEAWCPIGGPKSRDMDDDVIAGIARNHNVTPSQVMLRWHIDRGVVAIPKTSHIERMNENIDVFNFELTEDEMTQISSLDQGKRLGAHPDNFDF